MVAAPRTVQSIRSTGKFAPVSYSRPTRPPALPTRSEYPAGAGAMVVPVVQEAQLSDGDCARTQHVEVLLIGGQWAG